MRREVQTRSDVWAVVEAFYDGIGRDPDLGPFFEATDAAVHVPRMVSFWSAVAFQTGGYHERLLERHAALPGLRSHHVERWLARFDRTLDVRYVGPTAERMKRSARQIGAVFQVRFGLERDEPRP